MGKFKFLIRNKSWGQILSHSSHHTQESVPVTKTRHRHVDTCYSTSDSLGQVTLRLQEYRQPMLCL